MIVVMKKSASRREVANVTARIERLGRQVHLSEGDERVIIGVLGEGHAIDRERFEAMDGVDQVMAVASPFKLASRDFCGQGGRRHGAAGWGVQAALLAL